MPALHWMVQLLVNTLVGVVCLFNLGGGMRWCVEAGKRLRYSASGMQEMERVCIACTRLFVGTGGGGAGVEGKHARKGWSFWYSISISGQKWHRKMDSGHLSLEHSTGADVRAVSNSLWIS